MSRVPAALVLCLIAFPAQASPIPCWLAQQIVNAYGVRKAEHIARGQGYTDAEIAEAKQKCLTPPIR